LTVLANSLFVTQGPDVGKSITATGGLIRIGRERSNSLVINDDLVSRFHCEIMELEGHWYVKDTDSSNGTHLNGTKIHRSRLGLGDKLRIGSTEIVLADSASVPAFKTLPDHPAAASSDRDSELSPTLDSDGESTYFELIEDKGPAEAGRHFIQIHNDLRFLYRASLATTRKADPLKMLRELMDLIFDWIDADQGYVLMKDPGEAEFNVKFIKQRKTVTGVTKSQTYKPIVNYVCKHKVGVLSPKPLEDPRWNLDPSKSPQDISEVICVPIQGQSELLGLIYVDVLVDSTSESKIVFNEDHLRLMLAMAHQAAVAIEKEAYYIALVEKERMAAVGETAAIMSHRINNILQGINGGSHLVEKGLANQDFSAIQKGWETVSGNQEKITKLIKDLLILGKPFEPKKVMVDLAQVTAQAIHNLESKFKSAKVECRFSETGEFELDADKDAILQAFENLIQVAIEACNHDGQRFLEIGFDQSDENVILEIGYRGAEICFDHKDLVDPDSRNHDRMIGGIEFAVSRKIVRGHEGEIVIGRNSNDLNRVAICLPKLRFRRFVQQLLQTCSLDTIKEQY
jgi:two-component system NtrC family sensor kinase